MYLYTSAIALSMAWHDSIDNSILILKKDLSAYRRIVHVESHSIIELRSMNEARFHILSHELLA